jgi:hypothetical protein
VCAPDTLTLLLKITPDAQMPCGSGGPKYRCCEVDSAPRRALHLEVVWRWMEKKEVGMSMSPPCFLAGSVREDVSASASSPTPSRASRKYTRNASLLQLNVDGAACGRPRRGQRPFSMTRSRDGGDECTL